MTTQEARQLLTIYRGKESDTWDPQVAQALALAKKDPELGKWLQEHLAFHEATAKKLRSLKPPPGLKDTILARQKIAYITPWWWRKPQLLTAAATIVIVVGIAVTWITVQPRYANKFGDFEYRMAATAQREYRMDVETPDMRQVRDYMASKGAPGDYDITPGLQKLEVAGGGFLRWHSKPVSMVCFRRPDNKQMVYLFVMDKAAVQDPPSANPRLSTVGSLQAASWTSKEKVYVLAAPPEPDFSERYIGK